MSKKKSLNRVFILSFALGMLIPVLIISLFTVLLTYNYVSKEVYQRNEQLVSTITSSIEDKISSFEEEIQNLANLLTKNLQKGSTSQTLLDEIIRSHRVIISAELIDMTGRIMNTWPYDNTLIGTDRSGYDDFQNTLKSNKPYWSPSYISPQLNRPVSTLSLQVPQGVLTVYLDLSWFTSSIDRISKTSRSEIAIVDQHGTYIVHHDQNKVLLRESAPDFSQLKNRYRGKILEDRMTMNGQPVICYVDFIGQTGWAILVFQLEEEVTNPLGQLLPVLIFSIVIVFLLAIIVSTRQANKMMTTMQRLLKGVRSITEGDYDSELLDFQYKELAELAERFNYMAGTVQAREISLRENQIKLEKAQEIASLGYWEFSIQSGQIYLSDQVLRLFNIDPGSFKGDYKEFLDLVFEDDRNLVDQAFTKSIRFKVYEDVVYRIQPNEDKTRYLLQLFEPVVDNNRKVIKITGIIQDITEIRLAQEALIKWGQIFLNAKWGIAVINSDGVTLEMMNPEFANIHGYRVEELVGKSITTIFAPQFREGVASFIETSMKYGHHTFESLNMRKEGEIFPANFDVTTVKNAKGQLQYQVLNVQDITRRKQTEAELERHRGHLEELVSERTKDLENEIEERERIEQELVRAKEEAESANKVKSEFLANISHELRNPMHQILSYSKYGIDKIDKPREKLQHYFNQTRLAAERLMVLLNDLLDLTKMESGKMEYSFQPTDIYQLAVETISELKPAFEDKNLMVEILHSDVSTRATCDAFRIGQVLRNLISNAIKFTPDNKRIEIDFSSEELLDGGEEMAALMVAVKDQGIGIPEDELELIFDKFSQSSKTKTGAGGTGLGLAICYEIINAHKGCIKVKNNGDGEGATFCFTIPIQKAVLK